MKRINKENEGERERGREGENEGKREDAELKNAAPDYGTASLNLPAWLVIC